MVIRIASKLLLHDYYLSQAAVTAYQVTGSIDHKALPSPNSCHSAMLCNSSFVTIAIIN